MAARKEEKRQNKTLVYNDAEICDLVDILCNEETTNADGDLDEPLLQLLNRVGQPSLLNGRVHYILTSVYKSLSGLAPEYITSMFTRA